MEMQKKDTEKAIKHFPKQVEEHLKYKENPE